VLEVRHLRLVKAIDENGSMRRAADVLHLSQPALSRQLTALEQRIGAPLFLRAPRMTLTPAGRELLAAAETVLERLAATERRLLNIGAGRGGTLRLSSECNTCYQWLPRRLKSFQSLFPDVDVEVVIEATPNPLPWLLDGRLDLAIVSSEPSIDAIALAPLFRDEMIAVVRPGHPLAERRWLRPQDFADAHLFVYAAPAESNRIFQRVLTPSGVRPRKVTVLPLTEATVEMVADGDGVAVLARWAVARRLADGSLVGVPVTEKGFWRNWAAAYRKDAETSAFLKTFIELVAAGPLDEAAAARPAGARRRR
jgi:LysR family transcriptional regulator for metE and metH